MPARPEAGDEEMEGILYLLQEFKGKVVLFGISDVVDIAIMAFLIYKVIMLMRRTNSGAVAKGVLLLLFALGVSTFFHLNTVSYLLQQLMVWGVVALVVIFQPEIRRFLEQMGRTSLGKVFTPEEARNELDSAITQTVDAYMSLSKSKTVCFQNDRIGSIFQISKRRLRIRKILISCCRNVIFLHQIFRKCFGTFDDRCILSWSKNTQSF